jgi:predicted enzyme related to lactoylglutathione lyase
VKQAFMTNQSHRCRAVAVACGLALSVFTLAAAAALPPIADPPTGEHRPGKFVWIDLVTSDLAVERRFYGEMFGWAFAVLGSGANGYTLAYHAGAPVAGMVERKSPPDQPRQSRWIAFMSVPDVAAAAKQVTGKGGRVLIPPRAVENRGDMALLADPDGAPFGLIDSSSGDPPDFLPEVGEWIWALYQSPDARSAAAFYQDLGDYDVQADDRFERAPHFILVAEGFARASLVEIPAQRSGLLPDWLYFVRVKDIRGSLQRATTLGARIIAAPNPAVLDGRIAVIADPGGAPLGLLQWNEPPEEN